jgi:hypothetical protein
MASLKILKFSHRFNLFSSIFRTLNLLFGSKGYCQIGLSHSSSLSHAVFVKCTVGIQTSDRKMKKIVEKRDDMSNLFHRFLSNHLFDYDYAFDPTNKYLTENCLILVIDVSKILSLSHFSGI